MNYTVIVSTPVRFGVPEREGWPMENFDDIPFEGVEANISFRTGGAGYDEAAVMLIYHAGLTSPGTVLINEREIPDGLPSTAEETTRLVRDPDGPDRRVTSVKSKGRILTQFIVPAGTLRNDNTLRIHGPTWTEPRPFWLYNAVLFFKGSTSPVGPIGGGELNPNIG